MIYDEGRSLMTKIAIVTDSSCDLTDDIIQKYNIKLLPLKIIYSDREYRDRFEISPEQIYERFEEEIPKSSLPSPDDAITLFKELEQEGTTHVLIITISAGLSGTNNMLRVVSSEFENMTFEVLDSKALSLGLGIPVIEAAKEREQSNDFDKVVERAKSVIHGTRAYFVVKTLEYLKKGGRIGKVEGTIGDILQIKPIISINEEGIYYTYKKVRGRTKSIKELREIVAEKAKDKLIKVAVVHGNALEEAKELLEEIKSLKNVKETFFGQISPVLVVHTGPGLVGVITTEI